MGLKEDVDALAAAVAKETSDIDSFNAFVDGLKQKLNDALAGDAAAQKAVADVLAAVQSSDQKIVDAMAANVPTP